jgi:hypothetical protein
MAGGLASSLLLSALLAWAASGCVGQSAAPQAALLAAPVTPRTAETSAVLERDATVMEILRSYKARKAAVWPANFERLAAIDLSGAPCAWKALFDRTFPIPFRVRQGQPPFVRFSSGVLAVRAERGAPTAVSVMSDGGGIILHAVADVGDLGFYPVHPLTVGGFVRLHASARLSVSRIENRGVDARISSPTPAILRLHLPASRRRFRVPPWRWSSSPRSSKSVPRDAGAKPFC